MVLKKCEPELLCILVEFINKCLKKSYFPDFCKVSSLVPLLKNVWERSMAKNYSPASLFYLVSKVSEKLGNNKLVDHSKKCSPLSDFQCGFRSSGSAADFLAVVSDRIARTFHKFRSAQAVTLDIFEAFNRV